MVVPSASCCPRLVALMSPALLSLCGHWGSNTLQPALSFFSVRGCAGGLAVGGHSPVLV